MDDPAEKTVMLDVKHESAVLGISKINILELPNILKFGRYNDQLLKTSEVNKIITLFEKHGTQWTKKENAVVMVIESTWLEDNQDLNSIWNSPATLTTISHIHIV